MAPHDGPLTQFAASHGSAPPSERLRTGQARPHFDGGNVFGSASPMRTKGSGRSQVVFPASAAAPPHVFTTGGVGAALAGNPSCSATAPGDTIYSKHFVVGRTPDQVEMTWHIRIWCLNH